MPGPRWTDSELAVVLFFRSRGASVKTCELLLIHKLPNYRPHARTTSAVFEKLNTARRTLGLLIPGTEEWDLTAVDLHLRKMQLPNLEALTKTQDYELNLMGEVSELNQVLGFS